MRWQTVLLCLLVGLITAGVYTLNVPDASGQNMNSSPKIGFVNLNILFEKYQKNRRH